MTKLRDHRIFSSRAWALLASFGRDRAGSIVTMFAVMLPVLVGAVGLGVESGQWYANKRGLQTAADAAAISGAFERAHGNPSQVTASALRDATRNGFVNTLPNTIVVRNPPTTGPNAGEQSAVEVILESHPTLLLTSIALQDLTVSVRSVAQVQVTGTACVLALDPSVGSAISNSGNPTVNMAGCVLAANSDNASAINITGSSDLTADSLYTVGDYAVGGSATINLARDPLVHRFALDDPYADVDIPPSALSGGCMVNNASYNSPVTLNPGVYCNGISFGAHAHVHLNPGTYYIDAGDFRVNAGAVVTCNCSGSYDGVTFVLTSSGAASQIGTVTINGGADITLNAPPDPSSTFAGILFYQDRRAPAGATDKFNGGANQSLTGAIYFPNQTIEYAGNNSSSAATCTQIIGNQVVFTGNATINNTGCPGAGVQPLQITGVKVVE
jgi:Putative Flp pilus-assembly TadE/G-like